MSRHLRMLHRAIEVAKESDHDKWHLGAVVAQGSRILSTASNKVRNPPWIDHRHSTIHAEAAALARCLRPAPGAVQSMSHV